MKWTAKEKGVYAGSVLTALFMVGLTYNFHAVGVYMSMGIGLIAGIAWMLANEEEKGRG